MHDLGHGGRRHSGDIIALMNNEPQQPSPQPEPIRAQPQKQVIQPVSDMSEFRPQVNTPVSPPPASPEAPSQASVVPPVPTDDNHAVPLPPSFVAQQAATEPAVHPLPVSARVPGLKWYAWLSLALSFVALLIVATILISAVTRTSMGSGAGGVALAALFGGFTLIPLAVTVAISVYLLRAHTPRHVSIVLLVLIVLSGLSILGQLIQLVQGDLSIVSLAFSGLILWWMFAIRKSVDALS